MKKYRPGRHQVPNPFKKTESQGKMIPSSHVGANNYRRRNNSALRDEKRCACTGNRSARREKKERTVAAATIGNFFGHRSSPRLDVIGRADGVAAEIRRTDWPGTGVRKSLAAEFNACRAGWFIAMTLLSSPLRFSRRYDDASRNSVRLCSSAISETVLSDASQNYSTWTPRERNSLWAIGYNGIFLRI